MAIPLTINGVTYDFPEAGETDWRDDATRWAQAVTTTLAAVQTGSLATPVFNVKTYGATGNGVTDDTAAIATAKAAVEATGIGGNLYFPAGDYKISSMLQFGVVSAPQKNITISGDGPASRLLKFGAFAANPLIDFRNVPGWRVQDLVLDGANDSGTGDLLRIDCSSNGSAVRCGFQNAQRYGVYVGKVSGTTYPTGNSLLGNFYTNNASANVWGQVDGQYEVNVRDYGARGDDTTDDTAAFQAAIDALSAWDGPSAEYYRVLRIPSGEYRITGTLNFPASFGLHVLGDGLWNTFLRYYGPNGQDFLNINSSGRLVLEGFTLWGSSGFKANRMIFFDYNPIVFATTNVQLRDITIDGTAATDCYDYGIYFSDAYGNGSEVNYSNVTINKFSQSAWQLPGSQQKAHIMYGCSFNGGWNGTYGTAGGKYGVRCGDGAGGTGGAFVWMGGSASSVSEAAFSPVYPNDPILIHGVQSENCYRFLGSAGVPAATGARQAIVITGSRCDNINDFDANGYIVAIGPGPFIFEGNHVNGGTASPPPRIRLTSNTTLSSVRIRNNWFLTQDSYLFQPIINGTSFDIGDIDIDDNIYVKNGASLSTANRVEWLHHEYTMPAGTGLTRASYKRKGQCMILIDRTAFTAAATSQDLKVFELPRGTKIKGMYMYLYDRFRGGTISAVTASVGKTSGGNTYMTGLDVYTNNQVLFGRQAAELGTDLTTNYVQGGYVPDYFATTDIYVRLAATGGNLGDGTNTLLTTGYFFLILDLDVIQRFVTGA